MDLDKILLMQMKTFSVKYDAKSKFYTFQFNSLFFIPKIRVIRKSTINLYPFDTDIFEVRAGDIRP